MTAGVSTVARILQCVARAGPLTVTDICALEGLPRSSTFDIARRMEAAGLLARGPARSLVIGPAAVRLAYQCRPRIVDINMTGGTREAAAAFADNTRHIVGDCCIHEVIAGLYISRNFAAIC